MDSQFQFHGNHPQQHQQHQHQYANSPSSVLPVSASPEAEDYEDDDEEVEEYSDADGDGDAVFHDADGDVAELHHGFRGNSSRGEAQMLASQAMPQPQQQQRRQLPQQRNIPQSQAQIQTRGQISHEAPLQPTERPIGPVAAPDAAAATPSSGRGRGRPRGPRKSVAAPAPPVLPPGVGTVIAHIWDGEPDSSTTAIGHGHRGAHASLDGRLTTRMLTTKMVENPPSLAEWRQKLFDLADTVLLSQEEFEMYFPWVDNIYTHRSTQHYKRRPFTSHYWDCRMKGRPPGTNKSLNNPLAKKRKRLVRELNLCDVKIKISEYRPECISDPQTVQELQALHLDPQKFGRLAQARESFWTIQRINGNGTNGVGDQLPARHRHTLERSDEIKKSSAARWISEREKLTRRSLKPSRWKPTGLAWPTAKRHREEQGPEVTRFYGACFCPFSQRVWIALEAKGIPYQYCETNPFNKPKPTHLLEANPRGLVPAIRQGEWACGESTVILEYLEDIDSNVPPLHPTDPRLRANCRLWIDMINTKLVPSFYSLLRSTTPESQVEAARDRLKKDLTALVQAADEAGPWFLGDQMCLVDVHFAPFALRLSRLLQQHRGWAPPAPESRLQRWIDAIEDNPHVRNTTSAHPLYNNTLELLVRGCQVQEEAD